MTNSISPLAGRTLDPSLLLDVPRLLQAYYAVRPDPANPAQRIAFGTSGHRGSAFGGSDYGAPRGEISVHPPTPISNSPTARVCYLY